MLDLGGVMGTLVGLTGIRLPTLASHDRKSLTECAVLQASPGVVGCIERLVFTRRKEVGGRDTIDCTLEDRMEVFVNVGIRYPGRISDGDRRDRRTDGDRLLGVKEV